MNSQADKDRRGPDSTVQIWRRYAGTGLTDADAVEVQANIVQFISLLRAWSKQDEGHGESTGANDHHEEKA